MPLIRTVFRPWDEIEVSEEEAASMARQGLLSRIELGAPELATAPVKEVNTDGDTEEGSGEERPKGRRKPRGRAADPRLPDPQVQPGGEAGQSEPEEGSPTQEEGLTG